MRKPNLSLAPILLVTITFLLMVMTCSACNNAETKKLDITEMRQEDGSYTFPGLTWGMSMAAVKKQVQSPFNDPDIDREFKDQANNLHTEILVSTNQLYTLLNNKGAISFQFIDDKLVSATLTFLENQPYSGANNIVKLCESVTERSMELFGEPTTRTQREDRGLIRETKTWEHVDSSGEITRFVLGRAESENHAGSFVVMVISPTQMSYLEFNE